MMKQYKINNSVWSDKKCVDTCNFYLIFNYVLKRFIVVLLYICYCSSYFKNHTGISLASIFKLNKKTGWFLSSVIDHTYGNIPLKLYLFLTSIICYNINYYKVYKTQTDRQSTKTHASLVLFLSTKC